ILHDVYTVFTWPFCRTVTTFNLAGGSFTLPADYLSTEDDDALAIMSQDGQPTYSPLLQLDPGPFLRARGPGTSTGTPRWWFADLASGAAQVYPVPVAALGMQLSYQFLPARIPVDPSGDATVPVFPWGDYLVQELFARVLSYEQDARATQELAL